MGRFTNEFGTYQREFMGLFSYVVGARCFKKIEIEAHRCAR